MALAQVERLQADRDAIFELTARYARGLDTHDFDVVASCFAPNIIVSYQHPKPGVDIVCGPGVEKAIERLRGILGNMNRSTHFVGNKSLSIEGDVGQMELYSTSHMIFTNLNPSGAAQAPGTKSLRTRGLLYRNKAVRQPDGQWLFTEILHGVLWEILQPLAA